MNDIRIGQIAVDACSLIRNRFHQNTLLFFLFLPAIALASTPEFEQRREAYIDQALNNVNGSSLVLQAFRGEPVDLVRLQDLVNDVPTRSTADFEIIKLVRIMQLSNGQYDSMIRPMLDTIPLWLAEGDLLRSYWSENHWIMWNSSNWLLHEYHGRPIDDNLETRLRHYLRLKVKYGFYEFFSPIYMPFCFAGLMNLADFAVDTEMKELATLAAQRLMEDALKVTTDQGVFYPAAGRGSYSKYTRPYGHNFTGMLYLLTGEGEEPSSASLSGSFLASSTIDLDSVLANRSSYTDEVIRYGHALDSVDIIHAPLSPFDKVLFQWSGGAYFHPRIANESAHLIDSLDLWNHVDFSGFSSFAGFPINQAAEFAEFAGAVSKSSVITEQRISVFKHEAVGLSSVDDHWKGKVGYQLIPLMATVGRTAVTIASGIPAADWNTRPSDNSNDHLPLVKQSSNVALVMFRPDRRLPALGFGDWDVSMRFPADEFDEQHENQNWLIGRQDSNYVAVYRHCSDSINGLIACPTRVGQSWAIIVGNEVMYGSFLNFRQLIADARFHTDWYVDDGGTDSVFFSAVVFDNDSVGYEWKVERGTSTGIEQASVKNAEDQTTVQPNPASDAFFIQTEGLQFADVQVTDINGKTIYRSDKLDMSKPISCGDWQRGIYFVTVHTESGSATTKLIVK